MKNIVNRKKSKIRALQYVADNSRHLLFGVLLLLGSLQTQAGNINERKGITLQSTRIIYPEKEHKGVTFEVTNDTQTVYLVQSRIDTWPSELSDPVDITETETTLSSPFIVLPPLERLSGGEKITLRIRKVRNTLPTDRESVFAFQIKAIPGQSKSEGSHKNLKKGQAHIILALQNTLKLFYQPEGLPVYNARHIAESLQFRRQGTQLVVINPTSFYATFDSLSAGGKAIEDKELFRMVPPFGQQIYALPDTVSSDEVRWQLLDDYGVPTEPMTRALHNDEQ
ncbi:molecular chaperone [Providencia hangzhouensis]|uniref:fimbrial biogenesis chaperone n=1 Tax=Providencia hangzhouensis TaxID=3031799 RepID=UPI0034DCF846